MGRFRSAGVGMLVLGALLLLLRFVDTPDARPSGKQPTPPANPAPLPGYTPPPPPPYPGWPGPPPGSVFTFR